MVFGIYQQLMVTQQVKSDGLIIIIKENMKINRGPQR